MARDRIPTTVKPAPLEVTAEICRRAKRYEGTPSEDWWWVLLCTAHEQGYALARALDLADAGVAEQPIPPE